MSTGKLTLWVSIVCIGLFGNVAIGTFIGICTLLAALLLGNAPAVRKSRYEYEHPPQQDHTQPRDPNAN